ncbi:MAG: hypothetical protein H6945_07375 [Zoogloeaceae bacterium]|nr:hypothetical protein [Zoogloeaceae bacterium]
MYRNAGFFGLLAVISLYPAYAIAAGTASRGPSTPAADELELGSAESGVVELNPSRATVTTDYGIDSISSVRVDTDQGVIGAYAETKLANGVTIPLAAFPTTVGGNLATPLRFASRGSEPIPVEAELTMHGSFAALAGNPGFTLSASILALVGAPVDGSAGVYFSELVLGGTASGIDAGTIGTALYRDGLNFTTVDYAGATQNVLSADPSSFSAVVRLAFDVLPSDNNVLQVSLGGFVIPEAVGAQSPDGTEFAPSHGVLDFSHTAELSLYVPPGVSVGGDSFVANILQVSAVPEPRSYMMLLAGLAILTPVLRAKRERERANA